MLSDAGYKIKQAESEIGGDAWLWRRAPHTPRPGVREPQTPAYFCRQPRARSTRDTPTSKPPAWKNPQPSPLPSPGDPRTRGTLQGPQVRPGDELTPTAAPGPPRPGRAVRRLHSTKARKQGGSEVQPNGGSEPRAEGPELGWNGGWRRAGSRCGQSGLLRTIKSR